MSLLGTIIAICVLSYSASHFYPSVTTLHFALIAVAVFSVRLLLKKIFKPEKYINSRGYVVLTKFNELEHRYLAKQIIERELHYDEVVHHINGKRTDNAISNLCLMNNEKHEFFHSWLSWKLKKSGRYPSISEQKRVLEEEYGGKLLEKLEQTRKQQISKQQGLTSQTQDEDIGIASSPNSQRIVAPVRTRQSRWEIIGINLKERAANAISVKQKKDRAKKLFNELRKERKRIADEKGIPVYIVFDNKTLSEMAEVMPDSDSEMLNISGVGPTKLRMYGELFLNVIRQFRADNPELQSNSKDTA